MSCTDIGSCKKDKGNYAYNPHEAISITGLESSYTVISEKEKLVINPEITTNTDAAELEYLWGIYETNVAGNSQVLDTIAKTKNLDYLVKKPAKGWILVYRVTNKNTGYSQYFTSKINVVTQFTRGWYIAKDDGAQSDLDLFLTPTDITPTEIFENVYSLVNGKKLDGIAKQLNFFSSYKSDVTGTLDNTRTLFLTTNKNAAAMDINTIKSFRDINTLFYETPSVKAPAFCLFGNNGFYLLNNGQLHGINNRLANDGRFSARILKDSKNSPYSINPYYMIAGDNDPLFFDEVSSSFFSMFRGEGNTLIAMKDDSSTEIPTVNNNQKVIYMGANRSSSSYVYGAVIFQDKGTPSIKTLADIRARHKSYRTLRIRNTRKILPTEKLYNAEIITINTDENMLYFNIGNQIWSRNTDNHSELVQYNVPGDEQVTFIRHKQYKAPSGETAYSYNYVIIGTKQGGKYKVRFFTKSSGNLSSTPVFTIEGTGIARDVLYIAPSVDEETYFPNY